MKKHEMKLAADFLKLASDRFGDDICSDYDFPDSWTEEQKIQFTKEYHEWNGDPEEFDPTFLLGDNWTMMSLLADKLNNFSEGDQPSISPGPFKIKPTIHEIRHMPISRILLKKENGDIYETSFTTWLIEELTDLQKQINDLDGK